MTEKQLDDLIKKEFEKIENFENEMQQQIDVMNIKLAKTMKELGEVTENLQAFITLININNKLMREANEEKTDGIEQGAEK
tara:strand:- start:184 stop:426 length:243 start_codon:yes stop_codon:yes gene_type:complete